MADYNVPPPIYLPQSQLNNLTQSMIQLMLMREQIKSRKEEQKLRERELKIREEEAARKATQEEAADQAGAATTLSWAGANPQQGNPILQNLAPQQGVAPALAQFLGPLAAGGAPAATPEQAKTLRNTQMLSPAQGNRFVSNAALSAVVPQLLNLQKIKESEAGISLTNKQADLTEVETGVKQLEAIAKGHEVAHLDDIYARRKRLEDAQIAESESGIARNKAQIAQWDREYKLALQQGVAAKVAQDKQLFAQISKDTGNPLYASRVVYGTGKPPDERVWSKITEARYDSAYKIAGNDAEQAQKVLASQDRTGFAEITGMSPELQSTIDEAIELAGGDPFKGWEAYQKLRALPESQKTKEWMLTGDETDNQVMAYIRKFYGGHFAKMQSSRKLRFEKLQQRPPASKLRGG